MARALLGLAVLAVAACGTPIVIKRETRDFVSAGERAIDATRAFYDEVIAKDREASVLLASSDPGCRAENPVLLRGPVSLRQVLDGKQFDACTKLPPCDAIGTCNSICLSEVEQACWRAIKAANIEDADDAGFEFNVLPLPRSAFELPLELVEQSAIYLDVLSDLAEEAQPRIEARLTDLLDRACTLRDRIRTLGGASPASAPAAADARTTCPSDTGSDDATVTDTTLGKELKAVGSLIDLIDVARRNARDVAQMRKEMTRVVACTGVEDEAAPEVSRGECFERRLRIVAEDVQTMHEALLVPAEASIVASLSDLYAEQAEKLTQPKRAELFNVWLDRHISLQRLQSQEPLPAKLLRATAKSHAALSDMIVNGNYTDEQRRAIAAENRRWLEEFFRRVYNAVSVLGIV